MSDKIRVLQTHLGSWGNAALERQANLGTLVAHAHSPVRAHLAGVNPSYGGREQLAAAGETGDLEGTVVGPPVWVAQPRGLVGGVWVGPRPLMQNGVNRIGEECPGVIIGQVMLVQQGVQ